MNSIVKIGGLLPFDCQSYQCRRTSELRERSAGRLDSTVNVPSVTSETNIQEGKDSQSTGPRYRRG